MNAARGWWAMAAGFNGLGLGGLVVMFIELVKTAPVKTMPASAIAPAVWSVIGFFAAITCLLFSIVCSLLDKHDNPRLAGGRTEQ